MLKGQAREDFEEWYKEKTKYDFSLNYMSYSCLGIENTFHKTSLLDMLYCSPFSMQHGVLVDWLDSVGIQIYYQCDETIIVFSKGEPIDLPFRQFDTRHQARQKAIEQANTIYNDRK